MKLPLITAAFALAMSAPAANADMSRSDDLCSILYNFAEAAMMARQNGVGMPRALAVLDTQEEDDGGLKPLFRTITIAAYEQPRWNGEETRARAIQDFANEVSAMCYAIVE